MCVSYDLFCIFSQVFSTVMINKYKVSYTTNQIYCTFHGNIYRTKKLCKALQNIHRHLTLATKKEEAFTKYNPLRIFYFPCAFFLKLDFDTTESMVNVDWENGFAEASAKNNENVTQVIFSVNGYGSELKIGCCFFFRPVFDMTI